MERPARGIGDGTLPFQRCLRRGVFLPCPGHTEKKACAARTGQAAQAEAKGKRSEEG